MTPIRVLGIGSPAGDDQIGWRVADALSASGLLRGVADEVCILTLDRPGVHLVGYLEGALVVILIDAVKSASPPGTLHRIEGAALFEQDRSLSSHDLGVSAALALAQALGSLPPRLVLYGIESDSDAVASELSKAASDAIPVLTQRIVAELLADSELQAD